MYDKLTFNEYIKHKREKKKSTFIELNRYQLSHDKAIVISIKKDTNIPINKVSIAQAVKIIPEGKSSEVEIYYPYALTLSLTQAKEFLNILETSIKNIENK